MLWQDAQRISDWTAELEGIYSEIGELQNWAEVIVNELGKRDVAARDGARSMVDWVSSTLDIRLQPHHIIERRHGDTTIRTTSPQLAGTTTTWPSTARDFASTPTARPSGAGWFERGLAPTLRDDPLRSSVHTPDLAAASSLHGDPARAGR